LGPVDDLRKLIGVRGVATTYHMDRSLVRLYCDTVNDGNPKWRDHIPPGLLVAAMFVGTGVPMERPYPGVVDAGLEISFVAGIKVGDTLTVVNELCGVDDKSSEKVKRVLVSRKSTMTNQNGDVVATSIGRVMYFG